MNAVGGKVSQIKNGSKVKTNERQKKKKKRGVEKLSLTLQHKLNVLFPEHYAFFRTLPPLTKGAQSALLCKYSCICLLIG